MHFECLLNLVQFGPFLFLLFLLLLSKHEFADFFFFQNDSEAVLDTLIRPFVVRASFYAQGCHFYLTWLEHFDLLPLDGMVGHGAFIVDQARHVEIRVRCPFLERSRWPAHTLPTEDLLLRLRPSQVFAADEDASLRIVDGVLRRLVKVAEAAEIPTFKSLADFAWATRGLPASELLELSDYFLADVNELEPVALSVVFEALSFYFAVGLSRQQQ
mgnify:CR=1 FL=1